MRKSNSKIILFIFIFFSFASSCEKAKSGNLQELNNKVEDSLRKENSSTSFIDYEPQDNLPAEVKVLMEVYPDYIKDFKDNYIFFIDGDSLIFDDKNEKNFIETLDNSSLKDMFGMSYTPRDSIPKYQQDAGRSRNEYLFKKMYGNSPEEVSKNLVTIDWFGQKLPFTKINNASVRLLKVADELSREPEHRKYLKSGGTYYWRKVRGANRQSAHSYGIAMDIGIDYSDYWLWKYPKADEEDKIDYRNRIPLKIVEIFRKHGFIWGGAWYHFDTMHFEYRPEILKYSELKN